MRFQKDISADATVGKISSYHLSFGGMGMKQTGG